MHTRYHPKKMATLSRPYSFKLFIKEKGIIYTIDGFSSIYKCGGYDPSLLSFNISLSTNCLPKFRCHFCSWMYLLAFFSRREFYFRTIGRTEVKPPSTERV